MEHFPRCWPFVWGIHRWPVNSPHKGQRRGALMLLALCAGNSQVTGEFPTQRPATRSFDVFFNLCLNKWLSKQLWGWGFETPSRSLWRQCNGELETIYSQVPLKCGLIYHHVTYDTAITVAESESDIRITTDNPYHALTGELWGVYYEDLEKIDCTV